MFFETAIFVRNTDCREPSFTARKERERAANKFFKTLVSRGKPSGR